MIRALGLATLLAVALIGASLAASRPAAAMCGGNVFATCPPRAAAAETRASRRAAKAGKARRRSSGP